MTAIVFGSPEAAAVLERDRVIAELEDMALENAHVGFWVRGFDLTPAQRRAARMLVARDLWESRADYDMFDTDYRPNEVERERIVAAAGGGS